MLKRLTCFLLAIMLLFNITACNSATGKDANETNQAVNNDNDQRLNSENTYANQYGEMRIFTDDCGREVEIPAEITAYVPSGPLPQIILYAIAPEEMAGLATKWYDSAKGIISEKALNLPYLGQLYGSADLNVEELALAGPQILIDMGEAKKTAKEDLDTLQTQTNIPTVFISSNMKDAPDTFRKLGDLFGKEEQAEELAAFCERVYDRTLSIMDEVGDNKVKGLFVVGEEGLNVLAHSSFQAETFDLLVDNLAVVDNPVSKGTGNEVTMEQIAIWDPDFILFGPNSVYADVKADDFWSLIKAVTEDNYVEVPEGPHNWMGSPPAVQQYLGLIWLTAELYPEYCDYDVKAEIMEYYRLFYHCELTEEQYNTLTANAFTR